MSDIVRRLVRSLSVIQAEELVEHVPGPRPNDVYDRRVPTRLRLTALKLIAPCSPEGNTRGTLRRGNPTHYCITNLGREVAAVLLARRAEVLVEMGCASPEVEPVSIAPMSAVPVSGAKNDERSEDIPRNACVSGGEELRGRLCRVAAGREEGIGA